MLATTNRHAHRRNRLAMAGPAELIRMANLGESDFDEEESDDEPVRKARRKWNGKAEDSLIKLWVTGERAEMEQEDIDRELFEVSRDYMSASKLKKLQATLLSARIMLCGSRIESCNIYGRSVPFFQTTLQRA